MPELRAKKQAVRQPASSISPCSHGKRVTEPIPTPENAMLSARPRRATREDPDGHPAVPAEFVEDRWEQ